MSGTMISGVLLGLLIGVPTGLALQTMRRARKDYVAAKVGLPGLRTAYFNNLGKTLRFAAVIAVLVAAMFTWLINGSDAGNANPTTPASVPSPATRR